MNSGRGERGGDLVKRIERVTEVPMLILALAYVIAFVLEYLPGTSPEVVSAAGFAEYFIVAAFAAELVVKLAVANDRIGYLRTHWLDVLIVLVPFLRPLRPLRLLRLLPFLVRIAKGIGRVMGPYRGAYVLVVGLSSIFLSSVLMVLFERDAGGPIKGFGDALWWAVATITTVGYGDVVPVTPEGKAVAVFLMLVGISLFGVLTAGIAAYFVESAGEDNQRAETKALMQRLENIEARIEEQNEVLTKLLARRGDEEE